MGSSPSASGSRSFVTTAIVFALDFANSIFVTRFKGSVRSCLCQLLLLVGAIAKAKATSWNGSVLQDVKYTTFAHNSLCTFDYVPFGIRGRFLLAMYLTNIPQFSSLQIKCEQTN
jgi:hypothetical protein